MLTLDSIKQIVFPNETLQAEFVRSAMGYQIPGANFDEKLQQLFDSSGDRSLQLLLAPFLKKIAIQHLRSGSTSTVITIQNDRIYVYGNTAFNACLSGDRQRDATFENRHFNETKRNFIQNLGSHLWTELIQENQTSLAAFDPQIVQDFNEQKQIFVDEYGQELWDLYFSDAAEHTSASEDSNDLRFNYLFSQNKAETLKETFINKWGTAQWQRIHAPSAFEASFDQFKTGFLNKWGAQNLWDHFYDHITEDIVLPLNIEDDFEERKQYFIEKWQKICWDECDLSPRNLRASEDCQWIRDRFGSEIKENFQTFKTQFNEQLGEDQWQQAIANPSSNDLFSQYKSDFFAHWHHKIWAETKHIPVIPKIALELNDRFKNEFIETVGGYLWSRHLDSQSKNGVYARDIQLQALCDLFNLNCKVTSVTNDVEGTEISLHAGNQQEIHLYCIEDNHWFIYQNNPWGTLGDNHNCLYHTVAQWLKYLIHDRKPRKNHLFYQKQDVSHIKYIQGQLAKEYTPNTLLRNPSELSEDEVPAVQFAFEDLQTIPALRKEFDLIDEHSSLNNVKDFLSSTCVILDRTINSQSQYRRFNTLKPLLQNIATITPTVIEKEELLALKKSLHCIVQTFLTPRTRNVPQDWTEEKHQENILTLKIYGQEFLRSQNPNFQTLGSIILATQFKPGRNQALLTSAYSSRFPIDETPAFEETCLSSSLCMLGLFIMISGLISLLTLILLALASTSIVAVGQILLTIGLNSFAHSMGSILGLSAPYTATLIATTGGLMLTTCGYTLFKDFAPPAFSELLNIHPLNQVLPCFSF